jgi:cytochrome c oxidase subunit 1
MVFAFIGGVYYWFPKVTGRMMDDRLGRWNFWTTFFSFNGTFFPMHFLGLQGMPRRYFTYGEGSNWQLWNVVVSISAFVLGASILLFFYNVGKSIQHGELAGNNPWDAATLEWAIPSPPPEYNFAQIPQITHRDPLWWEKYDRHTDHRGSETIDASDLSRVNVVSGPIHMPNASYHPIIASFGILTAVLGLIFNDPRITIGLLHMPTVTIAGILIFLYGVYGWAFQPAS